MNEQELRERIATLTDVRCDCCKYGKSDNPDICYPTPKEEVHCYRRLDIADQILIIIKEVGYTRQPEPWDREQTIYEDGFKAGRKSWLLESKPTEPPADKVESITLRLENFLKVYDSFIERTTSKEVLKQAVIDFPREILTLFPEPELELLTPEEMESVVSEYLEILPRALETLVEFSAKHQLDKDRKAIRGEIGE